MPDKFNYLPSTLESIWKIVERSYRNFAPPHLSGAMRPQDDEFVTDLSRIDVYTLKSTGEARVRFYIDLKKYPDARAQEFGSGTKKSASNKRYKSQMEQADGTILIKPKNKRFLAFLWERADRDALLGSRIWHLKRKKEEGELWTEGKIPAFAGFSGNDDRLLFNYVHHPGIRAYNSGNGYMMLALSSAASAVANKVGEDAASQMSKYLRRKFLNGVKK